MIIERDVPVAMSDGVTLRADVFRPDDPARHPVVLGMGPYAKGLPFQVGYPDQWAALVASRPEVMAGSSGRYQNWEMADPEKWVPDGYVCLRVDVRGTGRSPGYLDHFSRREILDLYETIEWAAERPWCDGKVGLSGISYLAINQWLVAGLNPPHLAAMIAWEGAADWYRDMTHHGGILSTFWANWYEMQVLPVQHGAGDQSALDPNTGEHVAGPENLDERERTALRSDLGRDIASHPLDGLYYRERSADWPKVGTPFLSAANWGGHGLHARGNFEAFTQAASTEKWLEVHGHEHWTEYYSDYGQALQKRFFDRYLKGIRNGWDDVPRVLLQVRGVDGFTQRAEHEWPIARTQWTSFHLDAASLTLGRGLPDGSANASYLASGDGLTFTTQPFSHVTEITGPVAATLHVSSSGSDADIFAVVRLFSPAGEEVTYNGANDPHMAIAQGWLRASHRRLDPTRSTPGRPFHPHEAVEPLVPGTVYELEVEIWPTSIVVPAGYRLALTIRGRDYVFPGLANQPRVGTFRNALTGSGPFLHDDPQDRRLDQPVESVTIWTGPGARSRLLLPVVPATTEG